MGRVLRIELENFKSYKGRHVIGPFEQFTCIIGPNGAGKSNLMDAISFVLAISTKYLRSQNLHELVYHNDETDMSAETCSVSLFYLTDEIDNQLNEDLEAGKEVEFFRRVNANGSSQFKVNGRQITSDKYIKKLAEYNILVNCRNFIVYQGDVQNISTRSPEELTTLFEQISGSCELKEEYDRLREKREKLKVVMDMNLKKKYTIISERKLVQVQKEEADEYQKKQSLLRDLRVEYFLWQLYNIESNLEQHTRRANSLKEKCSDMENTDTSLRQQKDNKQREMAKLREKQRKLEKQQRKVEERIKQKQPESLKLNDKMHRHEKEQQRMNEELERLRKEQETVSKEKETLETELERMHAMLEALMESIPQTQGGVVLNAEQKEQYASLKEEFNRQAGSILQTREQKRREQETFASQIKQKTDLITSHQQELDNTRKLVGDLRGQQRRLTQSRADIEVIGHLEDESSSLQTEYGTAKSALQEKRQICERVKKELQSEVDIREGRKREKERQACVTRLRELFPDVRGLLVDLCNPTQKKYSIAVETALGKHLDAVVVNTKTVAIECIQFLKEQHMPPMDFYPLDSLKPKELRMELRRHNCKLCYELLEFDPAVEIAIRFAVGNTVVAENLTIARQLAYEEGIHEKVVTLDGEQIAKNGAMTGGIGKVTKTGKFQDKVIQRKQEELSALEAECQELEKRLQRNATNSERVRSVDAEILTQRGKLRVFNEEITVMEKKIQSYGTRMNSLESSLADEKKELSSLQKEEERLIQELSVLLQKCTVIEKRVYGSFLQAIGISSIQELESEYLLKLRENERMQTECRTHITLIESKRDYGNQRLMTIAQSIHEYEEQMVKIEKRLTDVRRRVNEVSAEMSSMEEEEENGKREIGLVMKNVRDVEIVIQEIDHRIRENRGNLKKTEDQISSERCAMETLRSKRNAVLKSAMIEQVQIPLLASRESQVSEGSQMEVENETPMSSQVMASQLSQTQTPQFSQSQAMVVQTDQEQVDRIDFSSLGDHAVAVSESEYGVRDEQYRERIARLASEVDKMTPDMLAEKKFKDISDRVSGIIADRKEMVTDYTAANEEFKDCCKRRKDLFMSAYEQVERVIDGTYKDLTRSPQFSTGGQALLALTNPDEPYLGGVKYTVSPVGKQYRDIGQLSGGEKTIATLALLFALHSFRRAPFFIMDEIDDALDNANVERVAKYLMSNSRITQCIIISHKDLLFEKSDSLVGVYHNWQEASSAILTIDLRKYDPESERSLSVCSNTIITGVGLFLAYMLYHLL